MIFKLQSSLKFFWFLLLIYLSALSVYGQVVLQLEELPKFTPENEKIFVVGSFNNWAENDSSYMLHYNTTSKVWECALPAKVRSFEYLFSRGTKSTIEADIEGDPLVRRVYIAPEHLPDTLLRHKVVRWADQSAQLRLRVTSLPYNTPQGAEIYLTGDFNGWNTSDPSYMIHTSQLPVDVELPPNLDSLHFKFTRGSWGTVEGGYSGGFRHNRFYKNTTGKPELRVVSVLSWEDLTENVLSLYAFIGLLFCSVGVLILVLLLSINKHNIQSYVPTICALVLLHSFGFLMRVIADDAEFFSSLPQLYLLSDLLWFSYGPTYILLVYQMTKREIDPVFGFRWQWWLASAFHLLVIGWFMLTPIEELKTSIMNQENRDFFTYLSLTALIFNSVCWGYIQVRTGKIQNYHKAAIPFYRLKFLEKMQLLLSLILVVWMLSCVVGFFSIYTDIDLVQYKDYSIKAIWILLGIPSILITFYALKYPTIFIRKVEAVKPKTLTVESEINKEISSTFKNALIQLMEEEKIYLQSTLSIKEVSTLIGTNTHTLSKLINDSFDKNFNDYINTYRIKEFIRISQDEQNNKNFNELFYEVGFNSKSTFNRAFKKVTGFTPSEYFKG